MSIFKSLTSEDKEEAKKKENALLERKLKRKFASAFDSAENIIFEAEQKIENARKDFEGFDVNEVLSAKRNLDKASQLQSELKAEYNEYFGEEFKVG